MNSLFICIFGLLTCLTVGKRLKLGIEIVLIIFISHLIMAWLHINLPFDAVDSSTYFSGCYLRLHDFWYNVLSGGTRRISLIVDYLKYFSLDFDSITIFFSIVSAMGSLFFYKSMIEISKIDFKYLKYIRLLVVLFPSQLYFTSLIGKDSVSYFAVCLAIYISVNFKERLYYLIIAIVVMYIVRAHIGMALAGACILQLLFDDEKDRKTLIAGCFCVVVIVAGFLEITGADPVGTVKTYETAITEKYGNEQLQNMFFWEKMFAVLFRPLPFEGYSLSTHIASIENILVLVLFLQVLFLQIRSRILVDLKKNVFLISYVAVVWWYLMSLYYNMGLAMRQKWMILPVIIFYGYLILHKSFEQKKISKLFMFNL